MSASLGTSVAQLGNQLGVRHLGRQRVIHGLLCALLAGQHAYLVGPPGTGKTELLKDLAGSVAGARFAQVDLHGQTSMDRLFGPIDIARWERGDGVWARAADGYLPTAHLAFLDEADAAPASITDLLLRLLAERTWLDGNRTASAPLITAVGAGNDIPGSDRLWDRFLVRMRVDYLTAPTDVAALDGVRVGARVTAEGAGSANATASRGVGKLTLAQLKRAQAAAMALPMPPAVTSVRVGLRMRLHEEGVRISDRRFVQSGALARAAAFLAGHDEVELSDLAILADAWWLELDQAEAVAALVEEAVGAGGVGALTSVIVRLRRVETRFAEISRWGAAGRELAEVGIETELDTAAVEIGRLAALGIDVAEALDHLEGLRELLDPEPASTDRAIAG
jgi:MoxR-like ATPase